MHNRLLPSSICLSLLLASCGGKTNLPKLDTSSGSFEDQISVIMQPLIDTSGGDSKKAVGAVVGITTPSCTRIYGFGATKKNGTETPDADTLFHIASITKTFTATILAQLVNSGQMRLDDTIDLYLPSSVGSPESQGKKIALVDLANHTSGLPKSMTGKASSSDGGESALYSFLSTVSLQSIPGTRYLYSNVGISLLGHLVSLQQKKSYEDLLSDMILRPLGMSHTFIRHAGDPTPANQAQGYYFGAFGGIKEAPPSHAPVINDPTGSIVSSANDLMLYLQKQMAPDQSELGRAIALTHESTFINTEKKNAQVGLGWELQGDNIDWKGGKLRGYRSVIGFKKSPAVGVFILANNGEMSLPITKIALRVVKLLEADPTCSGSATSGADDTDILDVRVSEEEEEEEGLQG